MVKALRWAGLGQPLVAGLAVGFWFGGEGLVLLLAGGVSYLLFFLAFESWLWGGDR